MERTSHCYYKLYSSVSDDFILLKDKLPSQRICSPSYCFHKIVICPDHQCLSDTSHSHNSAVLMNAILVSFWNYKLLFQIASMDGKWSQKELDSATGQPSNMDLHCVASLKCYNYVFLIILFFFFRQTKLLRELMLTKRKKN